MLEAGEKIVKSVDVSTLGTSPEFDSLKEKATTGNPTNVDLLAYANALLEGRGTPIDVSTAFSLFKRLHEAAYLPGSVKYGLCLLGGRGVEADATKALEIIKSAADSGSSEGMFTYATILQTGQGVPVNLSEATRYYMLSADNGNVDGMLLAAAALISGSGIDKNEKLGESYYKKAAELGNPEGQYWYSVRLRLQNQFEESNRYLKISAAQGLPEACYVLAGYYYHGDHFDIDLTESTRLYKIAADSGITAAIINYASALASGTGVETNLDEARKYLAKAANKDDQEAILRLAAIEIATENSSNIEKGIKLFEKAASLGNSDALVHLSKVYSNFKHDSKKSLEYLQKSFEAKNPTGTKLYFQALQKAKNEAEALKVLEIASTFGNPELNFLYATYRLSPEDPKYLEILQSSACGCPLAAYIYAEKLISADSKSEEIEKLIKYAADGGIAEAQVMEYKLIGGKEGLPYLSKAVAQENGTAMALMAYKLINGSEIDGITINFRKGLELMKKSSELGCPEGQYGYGTLLLDGASGIQKNYKLGFELMKKAADSNFVDAQFMLGWCYENGKGVNVDEKMAAEFMKKSADAGKVDAMVIYGFYLAEGKGVDRNKAEAAKYYQMAADNDSLDGQYNLAMMYGMGDGIEQNTEKAMILLNKAAGKGHQQSKDALVQLSQN